MAGSQVRISPSAVTSYVSGSTKIIGVTTLTSLKDAPYKDYDAIAIDEGQFFDDILDIIPHLDSTLILIAGLNGSFNRKNIFS